MGKSHILYHFTCEHGFEGITKDREITARVHPFMPSLGPLVWLTDNPHPTADDVGFGGEFSICDHMAYRYAVTTKAAIPWSRIRLLAPREVVTVLEKFSDPDHWFVMRRSALRSEFSLDISAGAAPSLSSRTAHSR